MLEFTQLQQIFERTKDAASTFMNLLLPLTSDPDEHTRLYYHHIFEEEEQRLGRLQILIPELAELNQSGEAGPLSDRELSRLLSDINLERFGLHNFREHLELALYHFQDEPTRLMLDSMREMTHQDYLAVKEFMMSMSEQFSNEKIISVVDHDEGYEIHSVDHLKASSSTHSHVPVMTKNLTIGSLRTIV